ncbi:MAG: beta-galactosidase [Verrucomicrobiae bacterium]|nr:beta-galactosidase [Verrucomicrobiae bacterium]
MKPSPCSITIILMLAFFLGKAGAHPREFTTNMDDFPLGTCGAFCGEEYRRQAYNMGTIGINRWSNFKFVQDENGNISLLKKSVEDFEKYARGEQKSSRKETLYMFDNPKLEGEKGSARVKAWSTFVTESGREIVIPSRRCYNNPDYRKASREILLSQVPHVKDCNANLRINGKKIAGIFNEPNWSMHFNEEWICHCKHCRKAWTEWLVKKYGGVSELNKDWLSEYKTLEEIDLPQARVKTNGKWPDMYRLDDETEIFKKVNKAHWMCWLQFRRDAFHGFIGEVMAALKTADPDVMGTANGYLSWLNVRERMGSAASCDINRHLDFGMVDAANAIIFGGKLVPAELVMYDIMLNQTHSALGKKPACVNLGGEHLKWVSAPGFATGEDLERMEIMAALYGMVSQIEAWYDVPDSQFTNYGGSLGLRDGIYSPKIKQINMERFAPVKRAYRVLQDFGRHLVTSDFANEDVAVLWAWEEHYQGIMAAPIQMLLRELGFHSVFVEQEDLDPEKFHYKALIISSQPRLSSKTVENIGKLAEKGVAILVDAASATQDWCGREQQHNLLLDIVKTDFGGDKIRPSLLVKKEQCPFALIKKDEEQPLWAGLVRYVKPPFEFDVKWRDKAVINDPKYRGNLCDLTVKGAQGLVPGFYKQLQPSGDARVMAVYDDGSPAVTLYDGQKYKAMTVGFNLGWEYWQGYDSNIFPMWTWTPGYFGIPHGSCHTSRARGFADEARLDFYRRLMRGFLNWAGMKKTVEVSGMKTGEHLVFRNARTPTCHFVTVMDILDPADTKDHPVEITVGGMPDGDYAVMDQKFNRMDHVKDGSIKIKTVIPKAGYVILMISSKAEQEEFLDQTRHRMKPGKNEVRQFLGNQDILVAAGRKCGQEELDAARKIAGALKGGKFVFDDEISEKEVQGRHLIVVGNPETNRVAAQLRDKGLTTVCFAYPGEDYGVLELNDGAFASGCKVLLAAGSSAAGTLRVENRILKLLGEGK